MMTSKLLYIEELYNFVCAVGVEIMPVNFLT